MHTLEKVATDFRRIVDALRTALPEKWPRDRHGNLPTYKAIRVRDLMSLISRAETSAEIILLVVHWRGKAVSPSDMMKRKNQIRKLGDPQTGNRESTGASKEEKKTAAAAGIRIDELRNRRQGKFTRNMWPEADRDWVNYIDPNTHRNMEEKKNAATKRYPAISIRLSDLKNTSNSYFNVVDDPRIGESFKGSSDTTNQQALYFKCLALRNACVEVRQEVGIEVMRREVPSTGGLENEFEYVLPRHSTGMPENDGGAKWVTSRPINKDGMVYKAYTLDAVKEEELINIGDVDGEGTGEGTGVYSRLIRSLLEFYELFAAYPEEGAPLIDTDNPRDVAELYPEGRIARALRVMEEMRQGGSLSEFAPPLGTEAMPPPPPTYQYKDPDDNASVLFQAPIGWPGSDGWVPGAANYNPVWSNWRVCVADLFSYPHLKGPFRGLAPDIRGGAVKHPEGESETNAVSNYYDKVQERERLSGLKLRATYQKQFESRKVGRGGTAQDLLKDRVQEFVDELEANPIDEAAIVTLEERWLDKKKPWYHASGGLDEEVFSSDDGKQADAANTAILDLESRITRERTVRMVWSVFTNPTLIDAHMRRLDEKIADAVGRHKGMSDEDAAYKRKRVLNPVRTAYGNTELLHKALKKTQAVLEALRLRAKLEGRVRMLGETSGSWESSLNQQREAIKGLKALGSEATLAQRRARINRRAKLVAYELMVQDIKAANHPLAIASNLKGKMARAMSLAPSKRDAPRNRLRDMRRGVFLAPPGDGGGDGDKTDKQHQRDLANAFVLAYAEATQQGVTGTRNRNFVTAFTKATIAMRAANSFPVRGSTTRLNDQRIHYLQFQARRFTRLLGGFDIVKLKESETDEDTKRRYPGFHTSEEYGAERPLLSAQQQFGLEVLSLLPRRATADGAFTPPDRTYDQKLEHLDRWRESIATQNLSRTNNDLVRPSSNKMDPESQTAENRALRQKASREAKALFYDSEGDAPPTLYELNLYTLYMASVETREALKWMIERADHWEPRIIQALNDERVHLGDEKQRSDRKEVLEDDMEEDLEMGALQGNASIAAKRREVDRVLLSARLTVHDRINKFWLVIRDLWKEGLLTYTALNEEWYRMQRAMPTMHWATWCFFEEFVKDVKNVQRWRSDVVHKWQMTQHELLKEDRKRRIYYKDAAFGEVDFIFLELATETYDDGKPNWDKWPALLEEYRKMDEDKRAPLSARYDEGEGEGERNKIVKPSVQTPWGTDVGSVVEALAFMVETKEMQPPIRALDDAVYPWYHLFRDVALSSNPDRPRGPGTAAWRRHDGYGGDDSEERRDLETLENALAQAERDSPLEDELKKQLEALRLCEKERLWYNLDRAILNEKGVSTRRLPSGARRSFNHTGDYSVLRPTSHDPTPHQWMYRSYLMYEFVYRAHDLQRERRTTDGELEGDTDVSGGQIAVRGQEADEDPDAEAAFADRNYGRLSKTPAEEEGELPIVPQAPNDRMPEWGRLLHGAARFGKQALWGGPDANDAVALAVLVQGGDQDGEDYGSEGYMTYMFPAVQSIHIHFPEFSDDLPSAIRWPSPPPPPPDGLYSDDGWTVRHAIEMRKERQSGGKPARPAKRTTSVASREPVPIGLQAFGRLAFRKLPPLLREVIREEGAGSETVWYAHPDYEDQFDQGGLWYMLPGDGAYSQTNPNGQVMLRENIEKGIRKYRKDPNKHTTYWMTPVLHKFKKLGWVYYYLLDEVDQTDKSDLGIELWIEEDPAKLTENSDGKAAMKELLGQNVQGYDWELYQNDNIWNRENFYRWFLFDRKTSSVTLTQVGAEQISFKLFEQRRIELARRYFDLAKGALEKAVQEGTLFRPNEDDPRPGDSGDGDGDGVGVGGGDGGGGGDGSDVPSRYDDSYDDSYDDEDDDEDDEEDDDGGDGGDGEGGDGDGDGEGGDGDVAMYDGPFDLDPPVMFGQLPFSR